MTLSDSGLAMRYIEQISHVLSLNGRVVSARLFGSRATGTFRPESDVDIVLYGDELSLSDLAEITDALDNTTIPYKMDILLYSRITSPKLIEHIDNFAVEFPIN